MARKSRYDLPQTAVVYIPPRVMDQVGIYLRLSVEDGDDLEHNSIGNQKKICLDYLERHTDLKFQKVYVDNGKTGMNYDRPGFQEMLQDLGSGLINCIVVKDISRLGRHYLQTSEYVMKTFPQMNVRLICVNDAFDSNDDKADKESLLMPFKLLMNDNYVRDTSKRIRSSIGTKMERGEYLPSAGSVPYGYIRNQKQNTYDIDLEAAEVIKRIYHMRSEGMKFNAIAMLLNQEGVLCPGKLRYERGITKAKKYEDAKWIRGTIRKIVTDPVYIGQRIHGKVKRQRVDLPKKSQPPENWQHIEDAHPAIISKELFHKVQEVNQRELNERRQYNSTAAPEKDYREVFRDVLYCGDCMSPMSGQKVTQRSSSVLPNTVAFNCRHYTYSNRKQCCNHHIRQEVIMECVRHYLDKQLVIAVDLGEFLDDLNKDPKIHRHQQKLFAKVESARCRYASAQAKVERLIRDMTEGLIDREEYMRLKERYSMQAEQLAHMAAEAQQEADALQNIVVTSRQWIETVERTRTLPELDRAIVRELFEQILVFKDKSLYIKAKYADPFAPILNYLKEIEAVGQNVG